MTDLLNGQAVESEKQYRRRAESGDTDAMYNLGVLLERRGQHSGAATWYRRAAKTGDVDAMFNLAGVLEGVGRTDEAVRWYRRAAEAGDADAAANLGLIRGRAAHPSATGHPPVTVVSAEADRPDRSVVQPVVTERARTTELVPMPAPPPPPVVQAPSVQWGQPAVPPSEPKRPGRILRRVLIGWNVLALIWLIGGIINVVVQSHSATANCSADLQQACQSAYSVGALIGVALVVFFWVAGDVILGVLYLVRGRTDRR